MAPTVITFVAPTVITFVAPTVITFVAPTALADLPAPVLQVIRLITPSSVEERMLKRANDRLRMGDLAIESGVFKVGATAREAQEMVKQKLDEGDLFDDIGKVDADIAGDEEMNEMLMRTEEEFDVWQKMDERRARENGGKSGSRLMLEHEVPEVIVGPPYNIGDRVSAMQSIHAQQKPREGTVVKRAVQSEYEVRFDDGLTEIHSRAMLVEVLEEVVVDEEAEKLGRRKQTKNAHAVSHHGLSDAEFTRCLEQVGLFLAGCPWPCLLLSDVGHAMSPCEGVLEVPFCCLSFVRACACAFRASISMSTRRRRGRKQTPRRRGEEGTRMQGGNAGGRRGVTMTLTRDAP